MSIGQHGTGYNCPTWKKAVVGVAFVLIVVVPIIYKIIITA